jgi:hypothetical protein
MNYDVYSRVESTDQGSIQPGAMPAAGLVPTQAFCIYAPMASGGLTGTADDVTVRAADLPQKYRVVRLDVLISTAGAGGSTVTLRDAAAGAGNALSTALSTASQGRVTDALTVTSTEDTSLYLRRSDRSAVGEAWIWIVPTV